MPSQLVERRQGAFTAGVKTLSLSASAMLMLGSSVAVLPAGVAHANTSGSPSLMAQVDTQSPAPTEYPQVSGDTRFACQMVDGQYKVLYYPQSQPGQAYPWATPTELGGGWTPDRRCNEISRRLETYRPDGLLEMQTGLENGYNTVCVTTQQVPTCRIVLTVPPGQDPLITRDRVFENLAVADSGQQTDSVVTYTDEGRGGILNRLGDAFGVDLSTLSGRRGRTSGAASIDLRPFLDTADGGTGSRLTGASSQPAPRLNPDGFR
ncbi:hypothetical protein IQ268_22685 [Oculatella sp. LEGE 06141]|uniref:COP23 domain-containing protein n=1 Tax=Oculatella sp. LEGE 06141 TaxID=1828648 RepID=UPI00187EDE44|nr:COP23 domain-containing protein [Oculatella sp. LEGE 06141]MBE9181372.1 hypothetical protein [Oculatella sp. LEGE 06141]